jgi:iduronate 2-sulfatase
MSRSFLQPCTLALHVAAVAAAQNVLLIVVDNLRPALGVYGDPVAVTPAMDALARNATVFANAVCQVAWCAPSRNSFLSGRRPAVTEAYNFLDSFREVGPDWVTLPGAFRNAGYYTTSLGKVFHPGLPLDGDAALSWSDDPYAPSKPACPNATMSCAAAPGTLDVDAASTDMLLSRLAARPPGQPFFAALGLQAPRLPCVNYVPRTRRVRLSGSTRGTGNQV